MLQRNTAVSCCCATARRDGCATACRGALRQGVQKVGEVGSAGATTAAPTSISTRPSGRGLRARDRRDGEVGST
jgi:hypothetical protein